MSLPTKLQLEDNTRLRTQSIATKEPGNRKLNSEVRKLQNRIASRNYREKRKRKLQQLQQLLEDDDLSEQQAHTRSTSRCGDRSCSGSANSGRSTASLSPHFTALSGNFASASSGHTIILNQAWNTTIASSTAPPLTYTDAYFELPQRTPAYDTNAETDYSTWNTSSYTTGTGYFTPDPSKYPTYPSSWPPLWYDRMYPYTGNQQGAALDTNSYLPLLPHQSSESPQDRTVPDSYGG
ncbi:hypothetical protein ST47_g2829 [Ascochyta rabiei]|uniref:Uncharacterized protein n=1 Tax=Didymella rabiei TaxID=5454 RepID=A0A163IYB9_DIDRA|nr:hypothetical protein ST47_g2829 [Ascochyta rabiei]